MPVITPHHPRGTQPCDHPTGRRTPIWLTPVAVGAAGLFACLVVAIRDPAVSGSYGLCPFRAMTGLDCPGCGLLRGAHAGLHGDVARALDHNLLWLVLAPVLVIAYLRWLAHGLGWTWHPAGGQRWVPIAVGCGVLAFWIARNLGGPFEYLASGA